MGIIATWGTTITILTRIRTSTMTTLTTTAEETGDQWLTLTSKTTSITNGTITIATSINKITKAKTKTTITTRNLTKTIIIKTKITIKEEVGATKGIGIITMVPLLIEEIIIIDHGKWTDHLYMLIIY